MNDQSFTTEKRFPIYVRLASRLLLQLDTRFASYRDKGASTCISSANGLTPDLQLDAVIVNILMRVPPCSDVWNVIDCTRSGGLLDVIKKGIGHPSLYLTRGKYHCVPRSSVPGAPATYSWTQLFNDSRLEGCPAVNISDTLVHAII
jgi:hypothetical protein